MAFFASLHREPVQPWALLRDRVIFVSFKKLLGTMGSLAPPGYLVPWAPWPPGYWVPWAPWPPGYLVPWAPWPHGYLVPWAPWPPIFGIFLKKSKKIRAIHLDGAAYFKNGFLRKSEISILDSVWAGGAGGS